MIDADVGASGDKALRFLSARAFDGEPGALRFSAGRQLGDLDGDGRAYVAVAVDGVFALALADLVPHPTGQPVRLIPHSPSRNSDRTCIRLLAFSAPEG